MSKKNKIKSGWDAYQKPKNKKENYKWVSKHTNRKVNEISFFDKIIKFIIMISLRLTFNKKIYKNKIKNRQLIDTTYQKISSPKFNFIPAGLGLYLFFSMIPISIIVISSIEAISNIPVLYGGEDLGWGLILRNDILSRVIPGVDSLLININLSDMNSIIVNTTIILLLISSIWFSSKGISKFIDSQSTIYEYNIQTNFIIKRMRSIIMVPIISIFFIFAIISLVPLIKLYKTYFPYTISADGNKIYTWEFETCFYLTLTLFLMIWSYLGVGLLFCFSPLFKLSWKQITPGILITIIPTVIFMISFGYLSALIDYSKYGAIGTFLYAITFVLVLAYFLYAGIIVNASYYKTFFSQRIIPKKWFITNIILEKIDFFKRKR